MDFAPIYMPYVLPLSLLQTPPSVAQVATMQPVLHSPLSPLAARRVRKRLQEVITYLQAAKEKTEQHLDFSDLLLLPLIVSFWKSTSVSLMQRLASKLECPPLRNERNGCSAAEYEANTKDMLKLIVKRLSKRDCLNFLRSSKHH
ncbi:hypothetical protein DM01DRAFT_1197648 [Hesseltinella vesiculosa]|uniref:Uncharacterized protein n=1 Tax=Hesseltinella vesiculosa TaxID=101127 RepID=A0A1X2G3J8_9FUNG|nr:hypothetical protein DM01DRAFT_1197648 [Hesseltinella vesiculosa]